MKVCTKCGKMKALDEFYADVRARDGLQCWCKECQSKYFSTAYKKKKLREKNTLLKKVYYYRDHRGLEYSYQGSSDILKFKCLDCGKEVVLPIKKAGSNNFRCSKCSKLNDNKIRHSKVHKAHFKSSFQEFESNPIVRTNPIKPMLPTKQSFNPFVTTLTFVKHLFRKPKNVISYNMDEVESVLYSGNKVEITLKGKDLHSQNAKAK